MSEYVFLVTLIIAGIGYILWRTSVPTVIHSNWSHLFPETQFSSRDFYSLVNQRLKELKVPEHYSYEVQFQEKNYYSRDRIYLRVERGAYIFDICAAPFGTGFFVSWWFGENIGILLRILLRIPLIGRMAYHLRFNKTYHMLDSEAMFREIVHLAVMEAIESLTETHGLRTLSDEQKKFTKVHVG